MRTQLSPFSLIGGANPVWVVLLCRGAWGLSDLRSFFLFGMYLQLSFQLAREVRCSLLAWSHLPGRDGRGHGTAAECAAWRCDDKGLKCEWRFRCRIKRLTIAWKKLCQVLGAVSGIWLGVAWSFCCNEIFKNVSMFLLPPSFPSWWCVLFYSPQIRGCFCLNYRIKLVRTVLSGGFCARDSLTFIYI